MSKVLWVLSLVIVTGVFLNSCGELVDIGSSSSVSVEADSRTVNMELSADMKMKMKGFNEGLVRLHSAAVTNWIALAVSTDGDKIFGSSVDQTSFDLKIPIDKTYFVYVGMVVGSLTNLYLISYPSALPILPMRSDMNGVNSALNLGIIQLNNKGALVSSSDPLSAINFTVSGIPFDADNDGIADFAGNIDKNFNGIPDAFENTQTIATSANLEDIKAALTNKNTAGFAYLTLLFAAEPAMSIYSEMPIWSNSVVTFALDSDFQTNIPSLYVDSWSNQVVEVALQDGWTSVVVSNSLASQWSNSVVMVVYDPNFQTVIPTDSLTNLSNLTAIIETNSTWANQATNWITNTSNTIVTYSITNYWSYSPTNHFVLSNYILSNGNNISNYFILLPNYTNIFITLSNVYTNSYYNTTIGYSNIYVYSNNVITNMIPSQFIAGASWTTTASSYSANIGSNYSFLLPSDGILSPSVWGTLIYTADSAIGKAAVQMGLINTNSGGLVTIQITNGLSNYIGSNMNDVTSLTFGAYPSSYFFVPPYMQMATNISAKLNIIGGNCSSTEGIYELSYAYDNSMSSRWASATGNFPAWIWVDLGSVRNVSKVILYWEASAKGVFEIATSYDAVGWTPIYNISGTGNGTTQILSNLTGEGRYIRMVATNTMGTAGVSLWEFEVYGN